MNRRYPEAGPKRGPSTDERDTSRTRSGAPREEDVSRWTSEGGSQTYYRRDEQAPGNYGGSHGAYGYSPGGNFGQYGGAAGFGGQPFGTIEADVGDHALVGFVRRVRRACDDVGRDAEQPHRRRGRDDKLQRIPREQQQPDRRREISRGTRGVVQERTLARGIPDRRSPAPTGVERERDGREDRDRSRGGRETPVR